MKQTEYFIQKNESIIEESEPEDRLSERICGLEVKVFELKTQNSDLQRCNDNLLQRYNELFENTPVGYITLSFEELILQMNQRAREILNIEYENYLNNPLYLYLHEDSRASLSNFLKKCRTNKKPAQIQVCLKNGTDSYICAGVKVFVDEFFKRYQLIISNIITHDLAAKNDNFVNKLNSAVIVFSVKNNGDSYIFKTYDQIAEKICNLKQVDVIGKDIVDVFPNVYEYGLVDSFRRVFMTSKYEKCPIIITNDGYYSAWIDQYIYKLSSDEIIVINKDCTAEKNTELELLFKNVLFVTQQQFPDDGLLILDSNKNVYSFNYRFKQIFDIPSEYKSIESNGAFFQIVFNKFSNPELVQSKISSLKNSSDELISEVALLRDGRIVDYHMIPLTSNDGLFLGRIWGIREVTDDNNNLSSFKNNEIGCSQCQGADEYVWNADFSDTEPLYVNKKYLKKHLAGLCFAPKVQGKNIAVDENTSLNIKKKDCEKSTFYNCISAPDRNVKWQLYQNADLLYVNRCIPFAIRSIADATKYKNAEIAAEYYRQRLIQADKMVSLGVLISGIVHEINNPNNFVMLNSEIFIEVWRDSVPILQQQFKKNGDFLIGGVLFSKAQKLLPELLVGMKEGTERIKKIVQSLKDYARNEDEDCRQFVDIHGIIDAAIIIMANMIKKSTDKFAFRKANNVPQFIGISQKLEQVIINLLCNACNALPNRDKAIEITTLFNNNTNLITICVRDEGVGIPEDILPHVMEPFFTTKRESGGTGLGLSISRTIVQAHHGTIDIESQPDKGTTVIINLPVSNPANAKTKEMI